MQQKCPPDRLNFANLIPSEKGVPNPNIPKKEKRPPKAKAYELIRLKRLRLPGMEQCWQSLIETRRVDGMCLRDGLQLLLQA